MKRFLSETLNGSNPMTSVEQTLPSPPDTDAPLKPHQYPAWLIGFAVVIICAVAYSAILIPPYLSAFIALRRGEAAIAAGNRAEAEARLEDAVRLVPSSKAARLEIAVVLLGDPSPAQQDRGLDYLVGLKLKTYEQQRVTAVLPERLRGSLTIGGISVAESDARTKESEARAKDLISRSQLDQAILRDPQNAGAYLKRAEYYAGKGEYERAKADYDQALRIDPADAKARAGRENVLAALDAATCKKAEGDDAITACDRALERNPDDATAYFNRGLAYHEKREYDRAIANYNEAIRLDPKNSGAYNNRGSAYESKKDDDRSIADYSEAIRLDPKLAVAYRNRGEAYNRKKEYDRAIADLDQAITLDPKSARAYNQRGFARSGKGELAGAIADYEEAIRLDPKFAAALRNRGSAFQRQGHFDRAIADFSEAIRLNPKDANAYYGRGLANLYAGSAPKAIADLNQLSELAPHWAYAAIWLDILNKRSQLASRLPQAIEQLDMTKWPAPVVRLLLGQMTPDAVLAAANSDDAKTKQAQVCEANFFNGELELAHGASDNATRLFRLAAADCPRNFTEWWAANAELRALGVAPDLPGLPEGHEVAPGVTVREVTLDRQGVPMQVWVYLPTGAPPDMKLPTVLIAAAGSRLFHGMTLGDGDRAEHVPYVPKGFAVLAYEIDGPIRDGATAAQEWEALIAFRKANAGVANAKAVIAYALARVPQVDPRRIYAVGHSSAATLALQVAEQDERVAACVAFAPVVSVTDRLAPLAAKLDRGEPGTMDFLRRASPDTNVARLNAPTLLFYAEDDDVVPTAKIAAFADELRKTNSNVKVITVPSGGHYRPMIEQGIPAAIAWLQATRPERTGIR
jgi:tetratricopeptide (TPR) repeat protein/dienelactone hydrolase